MQRLNVEKGKITVQQDFFDIEKGITYYYKTYGPNKEKAISKFKEDYNEYVLQIFLMSLVIIRFTRHYSRERTGIHYRTFK